MSSVPTGGSVCCACCNAAFHRLSSHLSWNARCAAFYDSLPSVTIESIRSGQVLWWRKGSYRVIASTKELKAPLKAFSGILNWTAKANGQGHIFHPDCQPSRRRVVHNLYCWYNMKGLIPKEKLFFLPYSRRTVPMIYFDAREVLASLLSCPLLNCDGKYLFDSPEQDPFIGPPKSSIIGDINTGQCYRKTYKAIVKNPFATFASSSLCCAYHVERTTSSSRVVSL